MHSQICMITNKIEKITKIQLSISIASSLSAMSHGEPTIECQKQFKHKNDMLTIAYWSSDVKYETVGKDRLITHLNDTL
jgi:hypothetical protein